MPPPWIRCPSETSTSIENLGCKGLMHPSSRQILTGKFKLRRIGNSVRVILPSKILKELGVKLRDSVVLAPNENGFQLTAEDVELEKQMCGARSPVRRYRGTLSELAK